MVKGQKVIANKKQIFREKPHITWDNFFSDDVIMDWCGENGFGMLCTVQRGRLPKGIPTKYFHKQPTVNSDQKALVARFNEPIIAVATFDPKVASTCPLPTTNTTTATPLASNITSTPVVEGNMHHVFIFFFLQTTKPPFYYYTSFNQQKIKQHKNIRRFTSLFKVPQAAISKV